MFLHFCFDPCKQPSNANTTATPVTPFTAGTSKLLSHANAAGAAVAPAGAYDFEIWNTDDGGGVVEINVGGATYTLNHGHVFNYEKYRNLVANIEDTAPVISVVDNGVTWRGYFWYPSTSTVTTGNI